MGNRTEPKPLAELLKRVPHDSICDYEDCDEDCTCGSAEMARRLRLLGERHTPEPDDPCDCGCRDGRMVCGCGWQLEWGPCPDAEILAGRV